MENVNLEGGKYIRDARVSAEQFSFLYYLFYKPVDLSGLRYPFVAIQGHSGGGA